MLIESGKWPAENSSGARLTSTEMNVQLAPLTLCEGLFLVNNVTVNAINGASCG